LILLLVVAGALSPGILLAGIGQFRVIGFGFIEGRQVSL